MRFASRISASKTELVGSQESERRYERTGADAGNAVELWQRVRPWSDCRPTQKKSRSKRAAVAATRKQQKIERGIWVALLTLIQGSHMMRYVRTILVGGLLHIRGEPCRQFSFSFRLALGKLAAGIGHANAEIRDDQQQDG